MRQMGVDTNTEALHEALAERQAAPPAETVNDIVKRNRDLFLKLWGDETKAAQFVAGWKAYMDRNPQLWECEPYTLAGSMAQAASLQLTFGPLGHAYLVPFKKKDGPTRATFILGYRGMVELAYRSGQLKRIEANLVREGDHFEFRQGTRAFLDYSPAGPPEDRDWLAVYALAELKSGGKPFAVLYPEDVARRRDKSPSHKSKFSPWQTDPEQMWE